MVIMFVSDSLDSPVPAKDPGTVQWCSHQASLESGV
jgi:hypothetical protein